jgi:hypothetical protein
MAAACPLVRGHHGSRGVANHSRPADSRGDPCGDRSGFGGGGVCGGLDGEAGVSVVHNVVQLPPRTPKTQQKHPSRRNVSD